MSNDSKPKLEAVNGSGSALRRFKAHQILQDVGVSAAFAGDALIQKLKTVCQQEMDDEAAKITAAAAAGGGGG